MTSAQPDSLFSFDEKGNCDYAMKKLESQTVWVIYKMVYKNDMPEKIHRKKLDDDEQALQVWERRHDYFD